MDLSTDIMGTSAPKLPSIVNHDWLSVDLSKYDNYPSDNNSVRIVPKLSELWNHGQSNSLNLIPNSTVMPLGIRGSDEDAKAVQQIVKEAKKAIMSGLRGKPLSQHLRCRFAAKHLSMAAEELKKVSEEIGLLGNVYIDASAFNTYEEAEQFVRQNRTRLARDILLNTESLSANVISMLASSFHKNVVASVEYNEDTFKKYHHHLVMSQRIPADFVIDSKETLRAAFLYQKPDVVEEVAAPEERRFSDEQMKAGMEMIVEGQAVKAAELQDSLNLSKISPIVSFVQENLAKGKKASALKEMLRKRFASCDIQVASEALLVTLSQDGLMDEHVDGLLKAGKITGVLAHELKRIGKKFPVKVAKYAAQEKAVKAVGQVGYFHVLDGKKATDEYETYRNASVEALRKGFEPNAIRAKLSAKLSPEVAGQIVVEAVSRFNSVPAGLVANKPVKVKSTIVYQDPTPKQTLPNPETIIPQTQEMLSYFEGCEMNVDIDAPKNFSTMSIDGLSSHAGIDETM
jgi:hypothetical protein